MNIFYRGVNQRGFGTWPLKGAELRDAILAAAEVGYRAFDTAQMYGNEADVGAALAETGLPRDAICVTTKVSPDNLAEVRFLPSVEQSIRDLGGTPPDVLLLHWPTVGGDIAPSLRLLQAAFDRGMARHVGVSNYTIAQMTLATRIVEAPVVVNQVEFHPLIDQSRVMNAASDLGIPLAAYCSIARGRILDHPEFAAIGRGHGRSAAQVALRWILQKGVCPITMSTKPENIRANFEIMDFTLSNVDMARIDALSRRVNQRVVASAAWAPEWDA